jgi:hypothetical protein
MNQINKERRSLITEWQRKRWDVVAIDASIILSTSLYALVALITVLLKFPQSQWCSIIFNWRSLVLILSLSVLNTAIYISWRLIRKQLWTFYQATWPETYREYCDHKEAQKVAPHKLRDIRHMKKDAAIKFLTEEQGCTKKKALEIWTCLLKEQ